MSRRSAHRCCAENGGSAGSQTASNHRRRSWSRWFDFTCVSRYAKPTGGWAGGWAPGAHGPCSWLPGNLPRAYERERGGHSRREIDRPKDFGYGRPAGVAHAPASRADSPCPTCRVPLSRCSSGSDRRGARWSTTRSRLGGYRQPAPESDPPGQLDFEPGGDYVALGPNVLVRLWRALIGRRS